MKRIISITILFLFLFSACQKTPQNNLTTTKNNTQPSTNEITEITTTELLSLNETIDNSKESTTKAKYSEANAQSGNLIYIFMGLNELKEIKRDFDTMEANEFLKHMEEKHLEAYMTGLWDYENSTVLLNEMYSTYVPVLDNDPDNISELVFYWQSNNIMQLIIFDEDKRASVVIDTVNCTDPKSIQLGDEAVCISEKTIEKDNLTARLYEYENTDYKFFAEILIEDTYIVLRSSETDSIEEFEACFNRLTFVKIGDLLAE